MHANSGMSGTSGTVRTTEEKKKAKGNNGLTTSPKLDFSKQPNSQYLPVAH